MQEHLEEAHERFKQALDLANMLGKCKVKGFFVYCTYTKSTKIMFIHMQTVCMHAPLKKMVMRKKIYRWSLMISNGLALMHSDNLESVLFTAIAYYYTRTTSS